MRSSLAGRRPPACLAYGDGFSGQPNPVSEIMIKTPFHAPARTPARSGVPRSPPPPERGGGGGERAYSAITLACDERLIVVRIIYLIFDHPPLGMSNLLWIMEALIAASGRENTML